MMHKTNEIIIIIFFVVVELTHFQSHLRKVEGRAG